MPDFAILKETAYVGFHGRPVVVPGQRGKNFRVGDVLEVGVVLADEGFTERRGYQNERREVVIFVEREAIT